jgi:hypothetical protein
MCTVLLPPGVNRTAVNRYININMHKYEDSQKIYHKLIERFLREQILLKSRQLLNYDKRDHNSALRRQAAGLMLMTGHVNKR